VKVFIRHTDVKLVLYDGCKQGIDQQIFNPLTAAIVRPFFGQKLPAIRARELFKPSTDSASLLVEIEKKVFRFRFGVLWR